MLRQLITSHQSTVWTALPGYIVDYDAASNTATVQPGIKGIASLQDGGQQSVAMPVLKSVPIVFPYGGGAYFTFPIAADDECLLVFASRSIDAWFQSGGIQEQFCPSQMHSLSDGFAMVGPISKANALTGINTTRAQLRSRDGSTVVELDPNGQVVNVKAPGGMTIDSPMVTFTGNIHSNQTVTADTDVVGGGKSLKNHTHGGVQTGSGTTSPPL